MKTEGKWNEFNLFVSFQFWRMGSFFREGISLLSHFPMPCKWCVPNLLNKLMLLHKLTQFHKLSKFDGLQSQVLTLIRLYSKNWSIPVTVKLTQIVNFIGSQCFDESFTPKSENFPGAVLIDGLQSQVLTLIEESEWQLRAEYLSSFCWHSGILEHLLHFLDCPLN